MRYIAYGSNLNTEQMALRCPGARISGVGMLKDYELLFKGSKSGAYLTIEPKKDGTVPVAVWDVELSDERALDSYEGFPVFYYKRILPVKLEYGTVNGFVYIMHEDRPFGIPSPRYVQTCREGYKAFGFNEEHLLDALNRSREEVLHEMSGMRESFH